MYNSVRILLEGAVLAGLSAAGGMWTQAGAGAGPAASGASSGAAPARVIVDLSDRQLYLMEGDSITATFVVSDGKSGHRTPRGEFTIRRLHWNPSWTPPESDWAKNKKSTPPGDPDNPMKVVKIFFREPTYYIHGTDAVESLGGSASHGCIRMSPGDVEKVGRWVMQHGGEPREENWFLRLLHSRREEKVVLLSDPVPIEIRS